MQKIISVFSAHPGYWWGASFSSIVVLLVSADPRAFILWSIAIHPPVYLVLYWLKSRYD